MAKRFFLMPVAAILATVAQSSDAAAHNDDTSKSVLLTTEEAAVSRSTEDIISLPSRPGESNEAAITGGSDTFKFVIRRSEAGVLFADHQSHWSHSSHSSHSSHYSSRW